MNFFRRLKSRAPEGIVLLYHRVIDLPSDPQLLAVTPEHFEEQMEVLRERFQLMSLAEMCESATQGRLNNKAVSITFDDGYKDNFTCARPILEQFTIPATFFVIAGKVSSTRELWWDEIERLVLTPGTLPEMIRANIAKTEFEWRVNSDAVFSEEMYRKHCRWNVLETGDVLSRQSLYRALHAKLRPLSDAEQQAALADLATQFGVSQEGRKTHRMISKEELAEFAQSDLFEIGAHTMTHPQLSAFPAEEQKNEIQESRIELQKITGKQVNIFAYPYGGKSDYSDASVHLVRNCGFDLACSNFQGPVAREFNAFEIPRFIVRDMNARQFYRHLRNWFAG